MNILVIADAQRYEELQQKGMATHHDIQWKTSLEEVLSLKVFDMVLDLIFDDRPEHALVYAKNPGIPVLAGMVTPAALIRTRQGVQLFEPVCRINR